MFTIDVKDTGVRDALTSLSKKFGNMQPVMQAIGDDIMERAKLRFTTGTGPDGRRWAPNARSTIEAYIGSQRGFGKNRFDGGRGINKKGQGLAISKKPLIGESKDLSTEFHVHADANSVTVGNTMRYAAIQQFGGTKAQFKNLWGDIPARPYFPIRENGFLYSDEQDKIMASLNDYLAKF